MPGVRVRKLGKKHRIIEANSNRIARVFESGAARDGGGHKAKAKAVRQAGYINAALAKEEK